MGHAIGIKLFSGIVVLGLLLVGFQNCGGASDSAQSSYDLAGGCTDRSIQSPNYIGITDQGTQSSLNGSIEINLTTNQLTVFSDGNSCLGVANSSDLNTIKSLISRISHCDEVQGGSSLVIRTQNSQGQVGGAENASPQATQFNGTWNQLRTEIDRLIQLSNSMTCG